MFGSDLWFMHKKSFSGNSSISFYSAGNICPDPIIRAYDCVHTGEPLKATCFVRSTVKLLYVALICLPRTGDAVT